MVCSDRWHTTASMMWQLSYQVIILYQLNLVRIILLRCYKLLLAKQQEQFFRQLLVNL